MQSFKKMDDSPVTRMKDRRYLIHMAHNNKEQAIHCAFSLELPCLIYCTINKQGLFKIISYKRWY